MRYEILFPVGMESDHAVYGSGKGETILLVEDDDVVRDVTAQVLEGCGYQVLAAKDAETADGPLHPESRQDRGAADRSGPGG
jgi:response regulator RpfG family c-di-GMP phosphodiesterase